MIVFVPFKHDHLETVSVQPEQEWQLEYTSRQDFTVFEDHEAWSMFEGGKCYGFAGVVRLPEHPHRGVAWALVGADIGRKMVPAVRFIRKFLDQHPCDRIELVVDCEFKAGHRFANLLGFSLEAPRMVHYGGIGRDMALYARVK